MTLQQPTQCTICGSSTASKYYRMIHSDNLYCDQCYNTYPHCASCGMPMTHAMWQLHDGRVHCQQCHATAVYDVAEANALYRETIAGVEQYMQLSLTHEVVFRLIDVPDMEALRRQTTIREEHLLGMYQWRGNQRAIYVLHGQPRIIFRTTVAHEYAHAWQAEQCLSLNNNILREGFAEWVAFYHLLWLGAVKAARRMTHPSVQYYTELTHLFALERQLGRDGVIDYMKHAE